MTKPAVYLITGIMAAGKSTVAEALAKRFEKGVHLRGDAFRRMIVSGRVNMEADASDEAYRQLHLRYDIAAHAADAYWEAGFTVAYQDVCVGEVLSGVVKRIQSRPLYVIVLCPDPEIVAKREAERPKTGYGGGFTPANFNALLLKETPRIGTWVDSSELTAEETVDEILARTGRGDGAV